MDAVGPGITYCNHLDSAFAFVCDLRSSPWPTSPWLLPILIKNGFLETIWFSCVADCLHVHRFIHFPALLYGHNHFTNFRISCKMAGGVKLQLENLDYPRTPWVRVQRVISVVHLAYFLFGEGQMINQEMYMITEMTEKGFLETIRPFVLRNWQCFFCLHRWL